MCQALRELMKDEIQKDIEAGRAEGLAKGILAPVETYRIEMGLDDHTITWKIAAKFGLAEKQAKAFVIPGPI